MVQGLAGNAIMHICGPALAAFLSVYDLMRVASQQNPTS